MKKKIFKRAGVAVLSMAMLLSMGAIGGLSASAVDSTISVVAANNLPGGTVKFYKVAEFDGTNGWRWTTAASNAFSADDLTALNTIANAAGYDTTGDNEITTSAKVFAALADNSITSNSNFMRKLATILDDNVASYTQAGSDGTITNGAASVNVGPVTNNSYYLGVITATSSEYIVQPVLTEVTAGGTASIDGVKASKVDIDKEIESVTNATTSSSTPGSVAGSKESAVAAVGDTVSFSITTNFPQYLPTATSLDQDFTITDTADAGLDIAISTITVYNTTDSATTPVAATNYTLTPSSGTGNTFTIAFNDAYVLDNATDQIKVTFNATVGTDAAYGTTGNTNDATVTFGNDYETGGSPTTKHDDVEVYTAKLKVTKKDNANQNLSGAGFTLYVKNASDTYVAVETINQPSSNIFEFNKLSAGEYKLSETTVPPGYTKGADIEFRVSCDRDTNGDFTGEFVTNNALVTLDQNVTGQLDTTVTNTPADQLPGTGGMGTILFTVGGAAIVLLAGAMFVLYMKKRRVEE